MCGDSGNVTTLVLLIIKMNAWLHLISQLLLFVQAMLMYLLFCLHMNSFVG
uniref:Uncharacterized protein n=1 Tax=Anguilla anguilla TaxID=7936 RepID=A0A0E9WU80_ANGAN